MNKQVVVAGLLGATQACTNVWVAEAEAYEADCVAAYDAAVAATVDLQADFDLDDSARTAAQGALNDHALLMVPFTEALTVAKADWQEQSDAKAAAQAEMDLLGDDDTLIVGAAKALMDAANDECDAQYDIISLQVTDMEKVDQAVIDHIAEVATLLAVKDAKVVAAGVADDDIQTATDSHDALVAQKAQNEVNGGQQTIYDAKDADATIQDGDYNTAVGDETDQWALVKQAKLLWDNYSKRLTMITDGCVFTGTASAAFSCETNGASDPIKVIKQTIVDAAGSLESDYNGADGIWDTKRTDLADAHVIKDLADSWKTVAEANLATINSSITSLLGTYTEVDSVKGALLVAKDTADQEVIDATTDWETGTAQKDQAVTDQTRGQAALDALNEAMEPLQDDLAVKTYLYNLQNDELTAQTAAKAAADALLADLATVEAMAQETVDRAQLTIDFYTLRLAEAQERWDISNGALNDNTALVADTDADQIAAAALTAMAISECKQAGYEKAQAALRAKLDKDAEDDELADDVEEEYTAASAIPTDGSAGTLCNFEVRTTLDQEIPARLECQEGLCCGAAQKFMKDGTKLAIETCQTPQTHTYEYYPPLPDRAVVAPAVETWRFQCISGAQKLAAAATAALAASYMMA